MPYMYSEMQNKLSKTRDSPLESMGQIISSRCPIGPRDIHTLAANIGSACLGLQARRRPFESISDGGIGEDKQEVYQANPVVTGHSRRSSCLHAYRRCYS